MEYTAATRKMAAFRQRITDIRQQMRQVQAAIVPQEVADYEFQCPDGKVPLSALFGDHDDLMVVHNMGSSCRARIHPMCSRGLRPAEVGCSPW